MLAERTRCKAVLPAVRYDDGGSGGTPLREAVAPIHCRLSANPLKISAKTQDRFQFRDDGRLFHQACVTITRLQTRAGGTIQSACPSHERVIAETTFGISLA